MRVKRILVLLLPVLLLFTGCAQLMGTSGWDTIEVTFTGSATKDQKANYTLAITPTTATYKVNGETQKTELPQGTWDALVTGVRALGERSSQSCPGGQTIRITARSGGQVSQTFEASSCDAGGLFDQAKQVADMLLRLFR